MPQNFQNWQALSFGAAPQSPSSQSGIPGTEFEDWANLTGPSDILKQAFGVQKSGGSSNSASAVPPPQNWSEAFDAAVKPYQQKFENVSNAMGQLGQGNTYGAYSAMQGQKPMVGPQSQPQQYMPQPQEQAEDSGFNFQR